jgi:tRNA modification GTPase
LSGATIAGLLTPTGGSALSVLAVLGPRAIEIVESLFGRGRGVGLSAGSPHYGWFGTQTRDDVVVHRDVNSLEPCLEISCHGGGAIAEGLIADLVAIGAERVHWRALMRRRGRSEFQCDALEYLANASTPRIAAILIDQLNGTLDEAYAAANQDRDVAKSALRWANVGKWIEKPPRVVLFGLPNVGKSTLFNALAGYSRAITSPTAGTTRDLVSETMAIDGWPVEIVDGAGLSADPSPLEAEGGRRLLNALLTAEVRVLVEDAATPTKASAALAATLRPDLCVANKIDVADPQAIASHALRCSAKTGEGLDELRTALLGILVPEAPPPGAPVPFLERHRAAFAPCATRNGA